MTTIKQQDLAQALFHEAGDGMFLFDPETGRLESVNPMALRLTGFTEDEVLCFKAKYLFRGETPEGMTGFKKAANTTMTFHSREGYLLRTRQEGVWVPVNLTITRLHVQPRTLGLITVRDVREQRENHLRVQRAEAELRRIVTTVSDCIWSAGVDAKGNWIYRYFSPVVEKLTGRAAKDLVGSFSHWAGLVHPEDRPIWEKAVARLKAGQATQDEYRIVCPDGSCRWVRDSAQVGRAADDGRSLEVAGILTDVTSQRQAAQALRESEEVTRSIIDTAHDAFVAMDVRGRIIEWNRQAEALLGWTRAEVLGRPLAETIIPPAQRQGHLAGLQRFLATGEGPVLNRRIEVNALHRSGRELPVQLTIWPTRVGLTNRFNAFLHDITGAKRLEEQLRQAQKMEAIGRLAGGVAHDFNNLLTVIRGFSEFMADGLGADHKLAPHAQQVLKAADRAAALTNQLLAFSRQQPANPRVLDLNALLIELGKMLHRIIGEDIELVMLPGPSLYRVRADPGQIDQVVMNLAVNARDAMPKGGKFILQTANLTLPDRSTEVPLRPGRYVVLSVQDTGVGMPEEVRSRVFEPFFTTKELGKGTGLGLSIVYGIVQQLQGHIDVASQPGKGTTFRIFLPALPTVIAKSKTHQSLQDPLRGSETILLVEDEEQVRNFTCQALEQRGYRVLRAGNGKEAVQVAASYSGTIHILVTDIVMPQLNGWGLFQALSRVRPDLKVLYMSGYTGTVVDQSQVEPAFLRKPFAVNELALKVREILDMPPK